VNGLSRLLATVRANTSGPVAQGQTESGSDLTKKSSTPSDPNTSIRSTSVPNTTTTHTILTLPQSNETFSSTTIKIISPEETITWNFKRERLNVVAAVDFAYSTGKKSDFTSIVVLGVDGLANYYILEIDRFKTDKISDYFAHILNSMRSGDFRKIRCEVSVAQAWLSLKTLKRITSVLTGYLCR
jgi:hypothetical protein